RGFGRSGRQILIFCAFGLGQGEIWCGLAVSLTLANILGAKIRIGEVGPSFGHSPFRDRRFISSGEKCLIEILAARIDGLYIRDRSSPFVRRRLLWRVVVSLVPF